MDRYQETFDTWNKIAKLYEDRFMNLDLYNDTYDFICDSIIKNKAKILELGCGPGNVTKYILSRRPDFNVYGIDVAPNMIALAKKNNPTARFDIMDIRKIHELKVKYNGIVCGFSLPYLSKKDSTKLIEDCFKLLEEDGLLYLSFVEGDPSQSHFQMDNNGYRSYFYFHDLNDLQTQLINNKFDNIKKFRIEYEKSDTENDIHTILIARKKRTPNND